MTITIPKPVTIISKIPKVPGWFFVAALVIEYAITNSPQVSSPSCTLKVNHPHYSSSLAKGGIDAIKVNIISTCTSPQIYTELTSRILRKHNGRQKPIYNSDAVRAQATIKNPNVAVFQEFWVECIKGTKYSYVGKASGYAMLRSGIRITVSGDSGKPLAEICQSKAK